MTSSTPLSASQQAQEDQYRFPYHYVDLGVPRERDLGLIEYRANLAFIAHQLRPWEGQTVLDVGCGDGRFIYEARALPLRFIGTDYSEAAIRFARAFNPQAVFHVGPVAGLHLETPADQAVMIEVLEHIPPAEIRSSLEAIAGLVKPGGLLIVTVPSTRQPLIAKHYQHFNQRTLRAALEQVFDVDDIVGMNRIDRTERFVSWGRDAVRFAYPLLRRTGVVHAARSLLEQRAATLQVGPPDACLRLMASCRVRAMRVSGAPK